MSEKGGWSEEQTDIFGNTYIQHYDEHGNKAGWSEEQTGLFGDSYTQHYDQEGDKAGWSEEQTGLFGDSYTQHYDQEGDKAGWSEEQTGLFGGEYTQHYDQESDKAGWSEEQTGLFGGEYTQHYDRSGHSTNASQVSSSEGEGFTGYTSGEGSTSGSYDTSRPGHGIGAVVVGMFVLVGFFALFGREEHTRIFTPRSSSSSTPPSSSVRPPLSVTPSPSVRPPTSYGSGSSAQDYVRQMLSSAEAEGGINNEEQILEAKRRVEQLGSKRSHGDRKTARAHNERGRIYINSWHFAEAVQEFQQAYQADPADIEVINNLGHAHMQNGSGGEAERFLFEALILVPGRSVAWLDLGQLYARQGSLSAAVACFANAYRFSPSKGATRQHLERLVRDGNENEREAAQHALYLGLVRRDIGGAPVDDPSTLGPGDRFANAGTPSINPERGSTGEEGLTVTSVGKKIERRLHQEGLHEVMVRESGIVITLKGKVASAQELKRVVDIATKETREARYTLQWEVSRPK